MNLTDHKENTSKPLSGEEVVNPNEIQTPAQPDVDGGIESSIKVDLEGSPKAKSKIEITAENEISELSSVEEDEDEHEIEDLQDESLFEGLEIDALVQHFNDLVKSENLSSVKNKIFTLKQLIEAHFEKERHEKYAAFLEEGNDSEEFAPSPSPLHLLYLEQLSRYSERRNKEKESRDQQYLTNFKKKEDLLEKLKFLVESEEQGSHDKLKDLNNQWREIGPVALAQRKEQWQRYHFLIDKFYDNLRINRELKELDLHKNLVAKTELCEKAEELLLETSVKKAVDSLNHLHESWKQIGPVPREQKETIWDRFKSASDKIYEKRKEFFQVLDSERGENLKRKEALCSKVEELIKQEPKEHNGWQKITESIEAIQAEWKTIGFAPKAENAIIWKRFKEACDQVYQAKNQFYRHIRQDQLDNLNKKNTLCEQAEALENSEDWKASTDALIRLQKEWKKIGPVPKKNSDKVWKRFRTACDNFFKRKNEHFASKDSSQEQNLLAKIALIERIEAFKLSGKDHEDLEALKALQKEWLEIGFIPLKNKVEIQEKYRNAINVHFDKLKLSSSEKTRINFQNKVEAIKQDKDGDKLMRKEHFQIQHRISSIQNDIALWENNMEFFTASKNSKNAEVLKKEIELKIEKAKTEIAQLKEKLTILRES